MWATLIKIRLSQPQKDQSTSRGFLPPAGFSPAWDGSSAADFLGNFERRGRPPTWSASASASLAVASATFGFRGPRGLNFGSRHVLHPPVEFRHREQPKTLSACDAATAAALGGLPLRLRLPWATSGDPSPSSALAFPAPFVRFGSGSSASTSFLAGFLLGDFVFWLPLPFLLDPSSFRDDLAFGDALALALGFLPFLAGVCFFRSAACSSGVTVNGTCNRPHPKAIYEIYIKSILATSFSTCLQRVPWDLMVTHGTGLMAHQAAVFQPV